MSVPRGAAAYKKKDGIITITDDYKQVTWTPNAAPDGPPTVSMTVSDIASMHNSASPRPSSLDGYAEQLTKKPPQISSKHRTVHRRLCSKYL